MKTERYRWWVITENLKLMRQAGRCSWCGKRCPTVAHHVRAKGMGGNKPPGDAWINLVPVGAPLECPCHTKIHSEGQRQQATNFELLMTIVSLRVGAEIEVVEAALNALARCTKDTTLEKLKEKGLWQWVIPDQWKSRSLKAPAGSGSLGSLSAMNGQSNLTPGSQVKLFTCKETEQGLNIDLHF
jgi:hypothetical protein